MCSSFIHVEAESPSFLRLKNILSHMQTTLYVAICLWMNSQAPSTFWLVKNDAMTVNVQISLCYSWFFPHSSGWSYPEVGLLDHITIWLWVDFFKFFTLHYGRSWPEVSCPPQLLPEPPMKIIHQGFCIQVLKIRFPRWCWHGCRWCWTPDGPGIKRLLD